MVSNNITLYANLSKVYIPAVSLNKSKPEELTIPELKCWIQCQKASVKGKNAGLIAQ